MFILVIYIDGDKVLMCDGIAVLLGVGSIDGAG
jgi:hypothetical protein